MAVLASFCRLLGVVFGVTPAEEDPVPLAFRMAFPKQLAELSISRAISFPHVVA